MEIWLKKHWPKHNALNNHIQLQAFFSVTIYFFKKMSFRKVIGWHRWKHRKTFQENRFISSANVSEKAKYCSALEDRESGEFHGSGIKWMSEWILWTSISASNISFQHEIYNNKGETISDWSLNKLKATYKLYTPNALIKWQTIVRFLDTVKMNFVTVRHFFFFVSSFRSISFYIWWW